MRLMGTKVAVVYRVVSYVTTKFKESEYAGSVEVVRKVVV